MADVSSHDGTILTCAWMLFSFNILQNRGDKDGLCSCAPKSFSPLVSIVDSILGAEKNQVFLLNSAL
jgi:hypothetical protein